MPIPAVVAAGMIAGGASLAGSAINAGTTGVKNKKSWKYTQKAMALQQQYALEQMQKQYDFQKQFYDYQNEYNDPSKVIERWAKAGINPAAVMGQSGAMVNATPSSSASVGTPGGPTQHFEAEGSRAGDYVANAFDSIGMASLESNIKLNEAKAQEAEANAGKLQGDTHSTDYRKRSDELSLMIQEAEQKGSASRAELLASQAIISQNDEWLSTISMGYRLEEVQANLQLLKDRASILREQSPALARQAEASLLLTYAQAYASNASADQSLAAAGLARQQTELTYQNVVEKKNFIAQNWQKEFEVNIYDIHGKVTGTKKMTLQDMYAWITQNEADAASYIAPHARYSMRSEKNRLGYSILNTIVGLGAGAAGVYLSKGKMAPSSPVGYEQETVRTNADGEFIGGTRVSRRNIYGK